MEQNSSFESYSMVGGEGPYSYAKNSSVQKGMVDAAKELIEESIRDKLDFKSLALDASNTFRIVDLGCSTGPNTFTAVQYITEAVQLKLKSLEFQVFFNDHAGNDFNLLFKSLPPSRPYFAAGVPGSFHGRLFPKSSIHFVHSCSAVHWLSKVPTEAMEVGSDTWNKAYAKQFKSDLNTFLNARAEEVVSGGLMAIILGVLPNGVSMSQTIMATIHEMLKSCLIDMAKSGLVSEEKVNTFNFPTYFTPINELEQRIDENGYFSIEKMTQLADPPITSNIGESSAQFRAVMEGLIQKHFGNEIIDQVFECFGLKLGENLDLSVVQEMPKPATLFVLLKRKLY